MQNATNEFQNAGFNPGGGFGGGFGSGIGLVGLLGLRGLGDERHSRNDDDCSKALFTLNAIGNLKDTIHEAKDALGNRVDSLKDNLDSRLDSVKDALTSRIEDAKDKVTDEGRALGKAISDAEKTNLQQMFALATQAASNTQAIKDQATAFSIVNDKRFDDLEKAGALQTATILAKINDVEKDGLRDQLARERRRGDSREIEISINNSNAQAQTQFQAQNFEINRKFDALFSQVAKSQQDIINVGGILAGVSQTANPVNVKS